MTGIPDELLAQMNWRQWEAHVQGLLRFYGWRHFHAPDNKPTVGRGGRAGRQRVEPGFPDVIAVRRLRGYGPELVVAELKTGTGRLSAAQRGWLEDWRAFQAAVHAAGKIAAQSVAVHRLAAVGVYVWRPEDLADVELTLAGPHGLNVPVDAAAELEPLELEDPDHVRRETQKSLDELADTAGGPLSP